MNGENFLLVYLALFLFVGAMGAGIGALEYRVVSEGRVERLPREAGWPIPYGNLSDRERRMVDRAIDGDRVVVRASGDLPGRIHRRGRFGVERAGETYLLDRQLFFNLRTKFARATGGLGLAGLLATVWAFRREHGE